MNEEYVEKIPKEEPAPVLAAHRWLLLGTVLLGVVFTWTCWDSRLIMPGFTYGYNGFWLIYLLLFFLFNREKIKARRMTLIFACSAAALCVLNVLQYYFGSVGKTVEKADYTLFILNNLAIPGLLMLHAQTVTFALPKEREAQGYALLVLHGFVIEPFIRVSAFFRAIASLFGAKDAKRRGIWIGLLVAVPVVLAAGSLLSRADAVFAGLLTGWFRELRLGTFIPKMILTLVCAMLFYSFLHYHIWDVRSPILADERARNPWEPTAPSIVLGALLVVYALFTYVQFVYLFGGAGLPEGLTYAEYAHEGFGQLIYVSGINLTAFCVCLGRTRAQEAPVKWLILGILFANLVIIASAFTRIGMYIAAYGLTLRRVMVVWLLLYVTAVTGLCAARLLRERKIPLLRLCAYGLCAWYVVLNMVDLTGLFS